MKLYHGTFNEEIKIHSGICLTDEEAVAEQYAGYLGIAAEIEIDLSGLVIEQVDNYDRDENVAVGDTNELFDGIDVLRYDDEDSNGRMHDTWRIISAKATARIKVTEEWEV